MFLLDVILKKTKHSIYHDLVWTAEGSVYKPDSLSTKLKKYVFGMPLTTFYLLNGYSARTE